MSNVLSLSFTKNDIPHSTLNPFNESSEHVVIIKSNVKSANDSDPRRRLSNARKKKQIASCRVVDGAQSDRTRANISPDFYSTPIHSDKWNKKQDFLMLDLLE